MRTTRIRLAAVGGAVCAALALASVSQSAATVPIEGSYASTCTSSTVGCPDFAGQETVLGSFKGVLTGVISPGTNNCPLKANACYTATLTTSNGDQVDTFSITYVTGVDASTGLNKYVEENNIVGGTGRFANATGTGAGFGEATTNNSSYNASVIGTITR
jgi:hypothetical protein